MKKKKINREREREQEAIPSKLVLPKSPDYLNQESATEKLWSNHRFNALKNIDSALVADSPMIYSDRRLVTQLLTRIKMFEKIIDIQGSIVECGVHRGNSLMTYYHLSSIFEPTAYNRKIIGFDTFNGFPSTSQNDPSGVPLGRMKDTNYEHLTDWVSIQDKNRAISHIPKIELVRGDACLSIPKYVKENPHLIISLLYLDFDLYKPTLIALKHLLPLVPKGGLIGFDEVNQSKWAGETIALKEAIGLSNIKLKRFNFDAHVSYYIVE
jgi:hypothetical protein